MKTKQIKRYFIIAFLILLTNSSVFAQFQRMRIPVGEFPISKIPTTCIDVHLKTPTPSNKFIKSSDNIFVKRTINGIETIKPLSEVNGNWIKLIGNNTTEFIQAIPINPFDKAIYTIKVTNKSGVVGGMNENILKNLPNEEVVNGFIKKIEKLPFEIKVKSKIIQDLVWKERRGYTKEFIDKQIIKFEEIGELVKSFGIENEIANNSYSNSIIPYYMDKNNLARPDNITDLLSLHYGQSINSNQIEALIKVTGRKFNPQSNKYNDVILLTPDLSTITVSSKIRKKSYNIEDLNSIINEFSFKNKKIFIDSKYLDDNLVSWLNKQGVSVVYDIKKLSSFENTIGKVKPIFVSSSKQEIVEQLFENSSKTDEIIALTKDFIELKNGIVVENEEQLSKYLKSLKSDEIPLVIFNNGSEGIMFNTPFDPNELKFGISCNTYKYSSYFNKTTDFIDLKCVLNAIIENQIKYGKNSTKMDEYIYTFQDIYTKCIKVKNNKIKAGLLIVGGSIAGGITYGYYQLKNE